MGRMVGAKVLLSKGWRGYGKCLASRTVARLGIYKSLHRFLEGCLECHPCVSVSNRLQCKHWLTLRMAPLQGNKHKEGVPLVVPPAFANFFIASTSAGAALVGLLFVAVSFAPEQIVTSRAPVERQAVAGSAFTALINAFFISLVALIPHLNIGSLIVPFIGLCLATTL